MRDGSVIHIVDDDEAFRTAISRVLKAAGYSVAIYPSAGDFLLKAPGERPACLLLDVRMPGPSGLELQQALVERGETLPIIFLTGFGDVPTSVRAMKAGAIDFLTKPVERKALLEAVKNALARDEQGRAECEKIKGVQKRFGLLSARERDVFSRAVSGMLNKEIAAELGMSERTVKAHRAHVMDKMEAHSFAELVQLSTLLTAHPFGTATGRV